MLYKIADEAGNSQLDVSPSSLVVCRASVCQLVVAGGAAGFAVIQAVGAETHFELGLTVDTIFFAPATRFRPLALGADDAAYAWYRGHAWSLARQRPGRNVTEVTRKQVSGLRSQVPGGATPYFRHQLVFF